MYIVQCREYKGHKKGDTIPKGKISEKDIELGLVKESKSSNDKNGKTMPVNEVVANLTKQIAELQAKLDEASQYAKVRDKQIAELQAKLDEASKQKERKGK